MIHITDGTEAKACYPYSLRASLAPAIHPDPEITSSHSVLVLSTLNLVNLGRCYPASDHIKQVGPFTCYLHRDTAISFPMVCLRAPSALPTLPISTSGLCLIGCSNKQIMVRFQYAAPLERIREAQTSRRH